MKKFEPWTHEWFETLQQMPKWREYYTIGPGNKGRGWDYIGPEINPTEYKPRPDGPAFEFLLCGHPCHINEDGDVIEDEGIYKYKGDEIEADCEASSMYREWAKKYPEKVLSYWK